MLADPKPVSAKCPSRNINGYSGGRQPRNTRKSQIPTEHPRNKRGAPTEPQRKIYGCCVCVSTRLRDLHMYAK